MDLKVIWEMSVEQCEAWQSRHFTGKVSQHINRLGEIGMTRLGFTSLGHRLTVLAIAAGVLWTPTFAQEQDHSAHMMTPEMFAELRAKIPLYQEYTDEQIMGSMNRMSPNYETYVSEAAVTGKVGVLGLAHGAGKEGDQGLIDQFARISDTYPTAMSFGMSMMTSAHIQAAVDQLVAAGAESVVVVPAIDVKNGSVLPQWHYIFDLQDEASYLSVPRIKTNARVFVADSPADHPVVSEIVLDFARELSSDPANELLIIASHGPEGEDANRKELALLETHADFIREQESFSDVRIMSIQDDAPSATRAANVAMFRGWVETARNEGKEVIVVTNLLTTGSVHKKLQRDLEGLEFKFNGKGLAQHERFVEWLQDSIDQQLDKVRRP
jgi:hypothetical protein